MSTVETVTDMDAQFEAWMRQAWRKGTGVVSLARSLEPPLTPEGWRAVRQFAQVRPRVAHDAHWPTPGEMAIV